jgi:hypothetical protein
VKWLVVLAVAAACNKPPDPPPPPPEAMPAAEVKRGQDACQAYVAKVCACADKLPAMKQPCALARALPDAITVAVDVAGNPESTRRDSRQSAASVRGIVKTCIEETAKLPAAGCP